MASVKIDTGPVDASSLLTEVPRDRWTDLMRERRSFVRVNVPFDCRELLRFAEEAEEMAPALGFETAEDFLRNGLEIDPELVGWAVEGLKSLSPDEPVTLERAVALGRHGGKREGAGRPPASKEQQPQPADHNPEVNQVGDHQVDYVSSGGTTKRYIVARLDRDHPELAEKVRAGDLSANAAAVKAGFRKLPSYRQVAIRAIRKLTTRADLDAVSEALSRRYEEVE